MYSFFQVLHVSSVDIKLVAGPGLGILRGGWGWGWGWGFGVGVGVLGRNSSRGGGGV